MWPIKGRLPGAEGETTITIEGHPAIATVVNRKEITGSTLVTVEVSFMEDPENGDTAIVTRSYKTTKNTGYRLEDWLRDDFNCLWEYQTPDGLVRV